MYVSIAALIIALASTIIGPRVLWNTTRAQRRMDSRQKWIDSVREKVASFAIVMSYMNFDKAMGSKANEEHDFNCLRLKYELELYLNRNKPAQLALLNAIEGMFRAVKDHTTEELIKEENPFKVAQGDLLTCANELSDEVWAKIKQGG
jgi:hypothetical protein